MPLVVLGRPAADACQLVFQAALRSRDWLLNVLRCCLAWFGLLDSIILGIPRSQVGDLIWCSTLRFTPPDVVAQERFTYNPMRSVFLAAMGFSRASPRFTALRFS